MYSLQGFVSPARRVFISWWNSLSCQNQFQCSAWPQLLLLLLSLSAWSRANTTSRLESLSQWFSVVGGKMKLWVSFMTSSSLCSSLILTINTEIIQPLLQTWILPLLGVQGGPMPAMDRPQKQVRTESTQHGNKKWCLSVKSPFDRNNSLSAMLILTPFQADYAALSHPQGARTVMARTTVGEPRPLQNSYSSRGQPYQYY